MNLLFIHQNYPGQFRESVPRLAASGRHRIVFLTQRQVADAPKDHTVAVYRVNHKTADAVHRLARMFDTQVGVAQAVRDACAALKRRGFTPDLIIGHAGWGEMMFVADVFPDTPMVSYFEYYFIARGGSVGFDPEFPEVADVATLLHARNAMNYLSLVRSAAGFTASDWQKQTYPALFHPMIEVLHEGIRTDRLQPDHTSPIDVTVGGVRFQRGDELVTYIARNLEPVRGVHSMLRSLPTLQRLRPHARIAVIGGDDVSYGRKLDDGETFRARLVRELGDRVDWSRVHFLGQIPYGDLLALLRLARAHVYLTVPFVVSWSMLEAMALEKVVIASDVAPVRQFIRHGETGLLVDFFSPEAIATTIARVLAAPAEHAPIATAARHDMVNRYDFLNVAYPAFTAFLKRVVDGRRALGV
jgi:glycosyltransferase involved in cell wall biosynthesis